MRSEKTGYFQNGARKERFSYELSFLSTSNIILLSVMPHVFIMQLFYWIIYVWFYTFLISFIFLWRWGGGKGRSIMSNSLRLHRLYSLWNSLGQNTGVDSLSLLQGIFPTQGSNTGLPHCRWILYHLSHQGSLSRTLEITYCNTFIV